MKHLKHLKLYREFKEVEDDLIEIEDDLKPVKKVDKKSYIDSRNVVRIKNWKVY
jgi:hypothetical protein